MTEHLHELPEEIPLKVSIDAFCELVAGVFNLGRDTGEQVVEMCFHNGDFRWSRVHSGRTGRDELDRRRDDVTRLSDEPPAADRV